MRPFDSVSLQKSTMPKMITLFLDSKMLCLLTFLSCRLDNHKHSCRRTTEIFTRFPEVPQASFHRHGTNMTQEHKGTYTAVTWYFHRPWSYSWISLVQALEKSRAEALSVYCSDVGNYSSKVLGMKCAAPSPGIY